MYGDCQSLPNTCLRGGYTQKNATNFEIDDCKHVTYH